MPLYGRNGHLLGDGTRLLGWCPGRAVAYAEVTISPYTSRESAPVSSQPLSVQVSTPWGTGVFTVQAPANVDFEEYRGFGDSYAGCQHSYCVPSCDISTEIQLEEASFGVCGKVRVKNGVVRVRPGGRYRRYTESCSSSNGQPYQHHGWSKRDDFYTRASYYVWFDVFFHCPCAATIKLLSPNESMTSCSMTMTRQSGSVSASGDGPSQYITTNLVLTAS